MFCSVEMFTNYSSVVFIEVINIIIEFQKQPTVLQTR